MNILPINKIILASFAFAFTNFKKILGMSVIPVAISIPFLTIFPNMLEIIQVLIVINFMIIGLKM